MRVGIAQINSTVGDFPANAKRILQWYRACLDDGAELVVTPAYALCGFPLQGLARKEKFVEKCLQALDYLRDEVKEVPLLVGHVLLVDGVPHKAASLLQRNKESLLISYPVQGEAKDAGTVEVNGYKLGVRITGCGSTPDDVDLMIHMDATAFSYLVDSGDSLFDGFPMVRCNAVGANDGWVFLGRSGFQGARGGGSLELKAFVEDCCVLDTSLVDQAAQAIGYDVVECLFRAMVCGVADFMRKGGYNGLCVCLDGSLASHMLTQVALEACGEECLLLVCCDEALAKSYDTKGAKIICLALDEYVCAMKGSYPMSSGVEERIRQLAISHHLESTGYLYLSGGDRTSYLLGESECLDYDFGGLAVLADVDSSVLREVGKWIGQNKASIPGSFCQEIENYTEQILSGMLGGESVSAVMQNTGAPEYLVRSIFRKYNLNRSKHFYHPVKLNLRGCQLEGSVDTPIIQTFVD